MLHTASHLKEREQGTVGHNPLQGPFPKSKTVSKFPLTFQHCENILTIKSLHKQRYRNIRNQEPQECSAHYKTQILYADRLQGTPQLEEIR